MRVLAIDSSINSTGYAVLEDGKIVAYGIIKPDKTCYDVVDKIIYIGNELKEIFTIYLCEVIIIEKLAMFHNNSTKTIQGLAGLYMYLQCIFRMKEYLVIEVYPSEWKSFNEIKGRKRAEQKLNSIERVKNLHGLEVKDDEADAICIGIYGLYLLEQKEE